MLQVWSISYRISMTSFLLYQLYQAILFWIRLSLYSDWHGVWAVFIIIIFIIVIVSVVVMIIIIIIIVVVPIIIIVIILVIIIIIIIIIVLLLLSLLSLSLLLLLLLSLFGKWYSIPVEKTIYKFSTEKTTHGTQTTNTSVQFNGDRATDVTRLLLVKSHVIDTYGQQLIW